MSKQVIGIIGEKVGEDKEVSEIMLNDGTMLCVSETVIMLYRNKEAFSSLDSEGIIGYIDRP